MSNPNIKPSDRVTVLDTIDPVSQGVGAVSTAWVSMATIESILAMISCGVLGAAATVDAKLQQAKDAAGTGAKDIAGKAITQLVKATDDGKRALINLRSEELDVNNAFTHVRLTVTVAAAASLVYGALFGLDARYQPASHEADVKEVVG